MSLLESFDKNTYAPLETQGFLKDKNIEHVPFGDYFKDSYNQDDKGNSIESALKVLNSYCKAQGRTDDVTYWDGQVREMMERVKRLRETLPVRTKVDNVFKFCEEMEDSKLPESEEEIKASMAEIAKMDAILKIKQAEERKAKLDTLQSEEQSRDILAKMECFERTTGIRNNFEEFMRLLNEKENTESSSLSLPQVEGTVREVVKEDTNKKEDGKGEKKGKEEKKEKEEKKDKEKEKEGEREKEEKKEEEEEKKEKEEKRGREDKKENQDSKQQKTISKFVERNIKLAKCGRGTLSVTDEEKSRLEDLLGDSETSSKAAEESKESKEPSIDGTEDSFIPEEECFGIDCDIQSALNKIDEQLEVLRSKRTGSVFNISFLEKVKSEEKMSDEDEKQSVNRRKRREKTPERLENINKQLQSMHSISREEIRPLSEKELANLVKQSKRGLGDWRKVEEKPEDSKSEKAKSHEEIIAELVSNAKTLMPKFKYRFGKS